MEIMFNKQIELITFMLTHGKVSMEQMSEAMRLTTRSISRYLKIFSLSGIVVHRKDNTYLLDIESPFFEHMNDMLFFSKEERLQLRAVLDKCAATDEKAPELRRKLDRIGGYNILEEMSLSYDIAQLAKMAETCIEEHKQMNIVRGKVYKKRSVAKHLVEPYLLMRDKGSFRCYDVTTNRNVTVKIDAGMVFERSETAWQYKTKHTPFHSDDFGYSSSTLRNVTLHLDEYAMRLLCEEYPKTVRHLVRISDKEWEYAAQVCNMDTLHRFHLGLWSHITVVHSAELERLMQKESRLLYKEYHVRG
jgi:hypothetical protein